ncbi:MAG TPA: hypothetical protein VHV75_18365 [Solirubrobacteraceae bacterium]|jgi:hypothetical protein|nr:hypothetical protein [Solirubrobacteraceae bacterium]
MRSELATDVLERLGREPSNIMQPDRLGSFWPTKLSFSHSFVRTAATQRWRCQLLECALDHDGRGRMIFGVDAAGAALTFVVFSDHMRPEEQEDRIIATRWDATAFLSLGRPTDEEISATRSELPKVVWGRATPSTLIWSRANRSTRLFEHVVASLAAGRQPDPSRIGDVGYLLRTTGFSANGRNGMLEFQRLREMDHPVSGVYHAQMLAALLWREYGFELAEHLARSRSSRAVPLDERVKRYVGVGNSSGIGLAPFVVRHPKLMHRWIEAREQALAEVLVSPSETNSDAPDDRVARLRRLLSDAQVAFREQPSDDVGVFTPGDVIAAELADLNAWIGDALRPGTGARAPGGDSGSPDNQLPLLTIAERAHRTCGLETQEALNSLLLELDEDDSDDGRALSGDEGLDYAPAQPVGELRELLGTSFDWALEMNMEAKSATEYFWYLSDENLEPRRGRRGQEPGEEFEIPLDVVGRIQSLAAALDAQPPQRSLARFLVEHPDWRFMVECVSTLSALPYALVRDNMLASSFVPLQVMRLQLAIYGMANFRPQSQAWVRGTLLRGAPTIEQLAEGDRGDGIFPCSPDLEIGNAA